MSIFKVKEKGQKMHKKKKKKARKTRGDEGGGKIGLRKKKDERNRVFSRILLYLVKGESVG